MEILPLFCDIDDFCLLFESLRQKQLLETRQRNRPSTLCLSEVMTIITLFHASSYRNFKAYYIEHVMKQYAGAFPRLVSYNRFVELMPAALVPLCGYLQSRKGRCSGVSFVDSTSWKVCHNRRIHSHKVFAGCARCGETSVDWFYGFKLHLVINDCGELLSLRLTPGNTDDRRPVPELVKGLFGKLFGDKGYVSQPLFETLYAEGVQLVSEAQAGDAQPPAAILRQDHAEKARHHRERQRPAQEHLADRAQPPPECGELLRQPAGRAHRLHVAREEAIIEHPYQRTVAACFLSSLMSNSR
jgi:hypothetical protein